jgi:hypothetical protein
MPSIINEFDISLFLLIQIYANVPLRPESSMAHPNKKAMERKVSPGFAKQKTPERMSITPAAILNTLTINLLNNESFAVTLPGFAGYFVDESIIVFRKPIVNRPKGGNDVQNS